MLTLLHSPAHIIAKLMSDIGLASTPTVDSVGAWPIYIGDMQTTPDKQIRINNTSGTNHGRIQLTGEMVTHPGIQIVVRDRRDDDGYAKAQNIHETLSRNVYKTNVTIGASTYHVESIRPTGDVLPYFQREGGVGGVKAYDFCYFSVNAVVVITDDIGV